MGGRLRWIGDGTDRFSWHDLAVFLRASGRGAALERYRDPEGYDWGTSEYLLAGIFDVLAGANWQRAGGKSSNKPTPIPRPGDRQRESYVESGEQVDHGQIPSIDQSGTYVGEATPIGELVDWLGW